MSKANLAEPSQGFFFVKYRINARHKDLATTGYREQDA